MAITDLLSRIPIPPALRRGRSAAPPPAPAPDTAWIADAWAGYAAPAEFLAQDVPDRVASGPQPTPHLPSWAVLAMGALALACVALAALLFSARTAGTPGGTPGGTPAETSEAVSIFPVAAPDETPTAGGTAAPAPAADAAEPTPGADPTSVPSDILMRLEAAGNGPLHGELGQLLGAVQVGFGSESAQLDPALRSYTTRMAGRFEWNPDTFRVAVTAPSADLAEARAGTLRRLFGAAVASKRLVVQAATGPDALTLVSH